MSTSNLGRNIDFPIYNEDGTRFHDLVLRKSTFDSVIMSLGDKITGDVYYKDNSLSVTMREYIEYQRAEDTAAVKYLLVSPPTIVREGLVSDNNGLNGMTKYTFEFYHPMYMLSSFSFSDVAVTEDEERYLSQNKKFSWIGDARDYVAKLNANLQGTQWIVRLSDSLYDEYGNPSAKITTLSEVLTFDNNTIADALKTAYETYAIPFVIDQISSDDEDYSDSKRFLILFGLPANEIYEKDENGDVVLDANDEPKKFVFRFGQGVGLKNNSRNPKKNKIITRIAGYGSTDNIPYGYPQIIWQGDQNAQYTIGDSVGVKENVTINGKFYEKAISYPIYDGIVGGQYVKLIKHPFTRDCLMPSVYSDRVNKKVNPYAEDYNPDIEIIDYYDATSDYPNPINIDAPSFEIHEFEKIKPQLGEAVIVDADPYDVEGEYYFSYSNWYNYIQNRVAEMVEDGRSGYELDLIVLLRDVTCLAAPDSGIIIPIQEYHAQWETGSCTATLDVIIKGNFVYATIVSAWYNVTYKILQMGAEPVPEWDDTMNDDGEYIQSYFTITLPQLSFDLYASAAITQNMTINMRSGACIGCTFPIQVDWEDYKLNMTQMGISHQTEVSVILINTQSQTRVA